MVDAGPDPRPVDRCLDQLGITDVPWLILTHLHADHIGGVAGVAVRTPGRRTCWSPGSPSRRRAGARCSRPLPAVPRTVAVPGLVVARRPGAGWRCWPIRPFASGAAAGEDSADENDCSLVLRVTSGDLRILLAGDVEEAGQEQRRRDRRRPHRAR